MLQLEAAKKHLTNSKSTGTLGWSRLLLAQNSVANGQDGVTSSGRRNQLHMSSSSCSVASKSLRVATKKSELPTFDVAQLSLECPAVRWSFTPGVPFGRGWVRESKIPLGTATLPSTIHGATGRTSEW